MVGFNFHSTGWNSYEKGPRLCFMTVSFMNLSQRMQKDNFVARIKLRLLELRCCGSVLVPTEVFIVNYTAFTCSSFVCFESLYFVTISSSPALFDKAKSTKNWDQLIFCMNKNKRKLCGYWWDQWIEAYDEENKSMRNLWNQTRKKFHSNHWLTFYSHNKKRKNWSDHQLQNEIPTV